MSSRDPRPPALARRLIAWASDRLGIPELADDAAELFHDRVVRHGERAARRWYRGQALASLWRVAVGDRGAARGGRARRGWLRLAPPGTSWLDLKLATRMLVKQPGLTFVAVFALAIGIPVGLLPLHVLDSLTAPLPVEHGERIVLVRSYDLAEQRPLRRPIHDFARWREDLSSFENLGLWRSDLYNVVSQDGRAAPVRGAELTASVFSLLRVQPLLGRPLDEGDEVVGAPDVVVIGHDLWRSRLASDPDAVGTTIRVGAVPHTVVGVMPEGFLFPVRDHLWIPFRHDPLAYEEGSGPTGRIIGRLAEGVSIEEARREIERSGQRMAEQSPETYAHVQPQVLPYTAALTEMDTPEARLGILITQALAFLLLTLACGNVGILILARAATRSGELAIRTAIGASRARIVSQLFVESLVLAVVAAGVGLLALQAVATGPAYLLDGLPFWVDFEISFRTAALALSLAIVSAAFAGVVPALKATGRSVHVSIQRAASGGSGVRFGRGYSALIVGEVAIAVWFLAMGSSLLPAAVSEPGEVGIPADQYLHASLRIPGIDQTSLPIAGIDATASGARSDGPTPVDRVAAAHGELARRLSAEPGLGPVAIASTLPGLSHDARYIQVEGMPRAPGAPAPAHQVSVARVDVGYFDALDQPILSGRNFSAGDLGDDRSAVIVNTSFVDRVLRGRNPIGQRLRPWAPGREPGPWSYEIVGVVGALGMNTLNADADEGLYHVAAPGELHPVSFAVRVGRDPERLAPRLRSIAADIDAGAVLQDPVPLDEVPNSERRILVLGTYLVGLLAAIAVVLAAACLFALMSFTVAERERESAIRTALGGRPANIVSAIARRAFLQLSVGVAAGAALSATVLWAFDDNVVNAGILRTAHWPLTVGLIALFVMAVGMLACVRPTLRALRVRPVEVLTG